jgi:hypothetical protein
MRRRRRVSLGGEVIVADPTKTPEPRRSAMRERVSLWGNLVNGFTVAVFLIIAALFDRVDWPEAIIAPVTGVILGHFAAWVAHDYS